VSFTFTWLSICVTFFPSTWMIGAFFHLSVFAASILAWTQAASAA
jgi:hypothetical protein